MSGLTGSAFEVRKTQRSWGMSRSTLQGGMEIASEAPEFVREGGPGTACELEVPGLAQATDREETENAAAWDDGEPGVDARRGGGSPIRYHLDEVNQRVVSGWAVHPSGLRVVRIFRDDVEIGAEAAGLERPDILAAFPDMPGSDRAGFRLRLGKHLRPGVNAITLEVEAQDGTRTRTSWETAKLDLDARDASFSFRPGTDRPVLSGLPFDVTALLRKFRPATYDSQSGWGDELISQGVEDLGTIWSSGARTAPLNRYILFLKSMYHRFQCISRRFPRDNEGVAVDAKDVVAAATTPEEMLAIANHLFVLRSNGLDGHFLEFGCFKGFSSCCLSYCCRYLDLPMDIFDSFAGLPPEEHDFYSAGEFCGTLEEVTSNINEFGDPRPVRLHKGFFSDSLPHFNETHVSCIWMDVDLFSSATDVAQVFDRLPRSSIVFTHEFPPDGASDGRVLRDASEVFPPILDKLESMGREPVGRYLSGWLGAIWDAREGIPVLPHHLLMQLVRLPDWPNGEACQ
ncbi:hypothetical protein OJF2_55190 [Aquisphaera giovannonii]|uniref:Macrocin-O-methyltransferase (TylF) n=2 Tax=Aquisphaera giovannonii TaxID=406548 RepID=A0A5B9W9J4_9BACT|nr:hypothetical protein OJF2_55190 [Aquisphaera giovannonii]